MSKIHIEIKYILRNIVSYLLVINLDIILVLYFDFFKIDFIKLFFKFFFRIFSYRKKVLY